MTPIRPGAVKEQLAETDVGCLRVQGSNCPIHATVDFVLVFGGELPYTGLRSRSVARYGLQRKCPSRPDDSVMA